jgi:PHD/YefM family antitoxin component YafN of YafNO toxin-antitoxin module
MNRHVPYAEFSQDLAKFMDVARTVPVYIERSAGTSVLVSKEQFEGLQEMAHRRHGSVGLLATLESLAPLNERLPPIPDPPPKPVKF